VTDIAFNTLLDMLTARKGSERTIRFIRGEQDEVVVPFSEHYQTALRVLAHLQQRGVQKGDQLILQVNDNQCFLEVFWACILGGVVPVPVAVGNTDQHRLKLFHVFDKLASGWLITATEQTQRLAQYADEQSLTKAYEGIQARTLLLESLADEPSAATPPIIASVDPESLAFIQFSSGSTSAPKGIALTHRNLLVNLNAMYHGMNLDGRTDKMLSWMPLTHDMGLIGMHILPVFGDVDSLLMPTELFVRRPALWMLKSYQHAATIVCSPNFGFQHYLKSFKPERVEGMDLSSLRLIFNGAEPISTELCHRFMQTLAPYHLKSAAMLPVYGLAEACLAVTFPALDAPFRMLSLSREQLGVEERIIKVADGTSNSVKIVCEGYPVRDCEVEIRTPLGTPLPEETIGHICIRGGNVTAGYYREPELNNRLITGDGWLDTGDLGFLERGALFVTGRAKDIIFVSGQNHYPHDLEEIVIHAKLVEPGKIAVSSERTADNSGDAVLVFVQFRRDEAEFKSYAASIRQVINEASGVPVHNVIAVSRLPKTTSGKVQRVLLVSQYQAGQHPVQAIAEQPSSELSDSATDTVNAEQSIEQQLLSICRAEMDGLHCDINDNLFEIGISSLTLATIHERIDETWPDLVDITDLFDHPTVAQLSTVLESKLAS